MVEVGDEHLGVPNKLAWRIIGFLLVLCIGAITFFQLIWPWVSPGTIDTFDANLHLFRLAAFHESILQGVIPPRWSSSLAYGWGSPVLHFNWSLPYWMAEPLLFLGLPLTHAYSAVVIISIVGIFISTYMLCRFWFDHWSGLAAAMVTTWALYVLYTIFISGAIGMLVGVVFWPLIFLSVLLSAKNRSQIGFIVGLCSFTGLILAHQVMFLMILPLVFSFGIGMQVVYKGSRVIRTLMASFIGGLGVTAYFWLPAIMEKQYINIGKTVSDFRANFIPPSVLFTQPNLYELSGNAWWQRVYGSHMYGLGWVTIIIVLVAFIRFIQINNNPSGQKGLKEVPMFYLFGAFFLLSLLLMTPYSEFLWKSIPMLSAFIYPTRFYFLALFCAGILTGFVVHSFRRKILVSLMIIGFTIGLNLYAIPRELTRIVRSDTWYFSGDSTTDVWGEFLPRSASKAHISGAEPWRHFPAVRVHNGSATLRTIVKQTSQITWSVQADTDTELIINQHYFPGWVVSDGKSDIPIIVTETGEMLIRVQPGVHRLTATFTNTPIRSAANVISLISVALFVWVFFHQTLYRLAILRFRQAGVSDKSSLR
jgi:hypothetical protein